MRKETSNVERITPEIAKKMLATSKENPRFPGGDKLFDRNAVNRLAMYMKEGKWLLNGQAITFDEDGVLRDGHHRLAAVIQSGCTIESFVTRGVDRSIRLYDFGGKGQRKEYEIMRGEMSMEPMLASQRTSAFAKMHYLFINGGSLQKANEVTLYEKGSFILEHQQNLCTALKITEKEDMKRKKYLQNSWFIYSFFCALECGVSESDLCEFARVVATGLCDDKSKFAAVICRQMLIEDDFAASWENKAMKRCECVQTALKDFCNGVARERKYKIMKAVYTEQFIKSLGNEERRI